MPLKTYTGTTVVVMLLLTLSADASEPKYSEARSDGFLGLLPENSIQLFSTQCNMVTS
jgi:hypothetical protein